MIYRHKHEADGECFLNTRKIGGEWESVQVRHKGAYHWQPHRRGECGLFHAPGTRCNECDAHKRRTMYVQT